MSKRIPFLLGLIILAIAAWVQVTTVPTIAHVIARLEDIAYDMQLRAKLFTKQHTRKNAFHTSVAIVDIDDKSLSQEGRWPWPRDRMAKLTDLIRADGAVVVAFDVLFPETESNLAADVLARIKSASPPNVVTILEKDEPEFDYDKMFSQSLMQIDSVLGITFMPYKAVEGVLNKPLLTLTTPQEKNLGLILAPGATGNTAIIAAGAKTSGFLNAFPDEDGIIRRIPLVIRYHNNVYPSLALAAVKLYLLSDVKLHTANYGDQQRIEGIDLGDHLIPTDAKSQVIVPFRGKSFTFPYYSAADVLNNKIAPDALQGKLVFVGASATGLGDLKTTAIQSTFPGVEIQATIADGLLKNNFSYKPDWSLGAELFFTVFFGLIMVFTFPYLGPRSLTLLIFLIPISLLMGNNYLWIKTGLILSVFIPMSLSVVLAMANMIYGYLFESRRREQLKEMFGQYVPAKHIDEMLTSKHGELGLSGEDREMTVLFADIRNFTSISEPLSAAQLKEVLNEFFTPMTEIIFNHRGTIDKYVGDLIMAFWGAPLKDKRHAQHGITAALEMQQKVDKLKPIFAEKGWAEIQIGVGLNSGTMSVGDMGSQYRRNYTVLGDAVNLASRVESLTKFYGAKILVTENTQKNQKHFVFKKMDRVHVKGKTQGIEIYEPLCKQSELTPELRNELERHHHALELYFQREWKKAAELFTELKEQFPLCKVYSLYLHRIHEYIENPPSMEWDGTFTHTAK